METNYFHSPVTLIALVFCAGLAFDIFRRNKNVGNFCLFIGFTLLVPGRIMAKYCTNISMVDKTFVEESYLCNPAIPYIEGVGFCLIAYGLLKILQSKDT